MRIASNEVQQFIKENESVDEKALVLKHKMILGLPSSKIAEQISGRRKTKEKLPTFYTTTGIVYPPSVNLEQSSSEATALYKSEIIKKITDKTPRSMCADLTGGFGVDSFFLSKIFKTVFHIESNNDLLSLTKHNHNLLGVKNISYYNILAEDFLKTHNERFDLINIDPSRRSTYNKKVFKLSECEPDITALSDSIFAKAKHLLLKASPLIDIQQGLLELPGTESVYVVSVDNECKEVLFLCSANGIKDPVINAVTIQQGRTHEFSFTRHQEKNAISNFSEPLVYLYEPNSSLLKSGAFKLVGSTFGLSKIDHNTHFYTSNELKSDFPGRVFKIIAAVKPSLKAVKPHFPDGKGNVITRNYPLKAESLKKKVSLKDGGEKYLIAFSSTSKKHVFVADRLK